MGEFACVRKSYIAMGTKAFQDVMAKCNAPGYVAGLIGQYEVPWVELGFMVWCNSEASFPTCAVSQCIQWPLHTGGWGKE